jgi:hypothetical protein
MVHSLVMEVIQTIIQIVIKNQYKRIKRSVTVTVKDKCPSCDLDLFTGAFKTIADLDDAITWSFEGEDDKGDDKKGDDNKRNDNKGGNDNRRKEKPKHGRKKNNQRKNRKKKPKKARILLNTIFDFFVL